MKRIHVNITFVLSVPEDIDPSTVDIEFMNDYEDLEKAFSVCGRSQLCGTRESIYEFNLEDIRSIRSYGT